MYARSVCCYVSRLCVCLYASFSIFYISKLLPFKVTTYPLRLRFDFAHL